MPNEQMFSLESLADGALAEQINDGLKAVIENIADPNTQSKAKRKLTVSITFTPDEERGLAEVSMAVKPTLAPAIPTKTRILIGRNLDGTVVGAEFRKGVPGQVNMDIDKETNELKTIEPDLPPGLKVVR